jgi:hypothetical protein
MRYEPALQKQFKAAITTSHASTGERHLRRKRESVMASRKSILIAALALTAAFGGAGSASAETMWQRDHQGRVEINHRLQNQNRRIDHERREGKISRQQAFYLHREDHSIRARERFDSRFDRGHLSRAQYRTLNREESGVSRQIDR